MDVLALCEGVKRAQVTCELSTAGSEPDMLYICHAGSVLDVNRLPASLEQLCVTDLGKHEAQQALVGLVNWGVWEAPNLTWLEVRVDWSAHQCRLQKIADDGEFVWTPAGDDEFMALGQRYPWQISDPVCEYDDEDELFHAIQDGGVQDAMDGLTQTVLHARYRQRSYAPQLALRFDGPHEGQARGRLRNTYV